jgi:hypothetical protein
MLKAIINNVYNRKKIAPNTQVDLSTPATKFFITIFEVSFKKLLDSFNTRYYYCYLNLY